VIYPFPIRAIAKSSDINSSHGAMFNALLRIVIPLTAFPLSVYAQPRFLSTSELFPMSLFDFSKYFIDSRILS